MPPSFQTVPGQLDDLDDAGRDLRHPQATGVATGEEDLDGLGRGIHAASVPAKPRTSI